MDDLSSGELAMRGKWLPRSVLTEGATEDRSPGTEVLRLYVRSWLDVSRFIFFFLP